MKKLVQILLITIISGNSLIAQERADSLYQKTFDYLTTMLKGDTAISFKNAVYAVENSFIGGSLSYENYNQSIDHYAKSAITFAEKSELLYEGSDKEVVQKLGSIFMIMTSTEPMWLDSIIFQPAPFTYDFEDFWGEFDWTKMFVSKLLTTHSGNCHSLPYLYKILADELGVKAYLSMAPNHTYIKIRSQNPKIGWYNTELTNATFPIDAWIKSSGYVHLDAIRNGLYMDTLGVKQEIALCLIDLAKGYERKFDSTDFLMKCANTALEYYPNYVNALLLKAETMKKNFEANPADPEAQSLFLEMEALYFKIFKLGYRTMPKEMYISWLTDLKEHKEKYLNENFSNLTTNED